VPERPCRPGERGLLTRPVPVELPAVPIVLSWHHRYDSDPAHAWLRADGAGWGPGPRRGRMPP
jgi:hypothetical protein